MILIKIEQQSETIINKICELNRAFLSKSPFFLPLYKKNCTQASLTQKMSRKVAKPQSFR